MKVWKFLAYTCFGTLVLGIAFVFWMLSHPQVARVTFSRDRYCEMKVYPFYVKDSVISYFESGKLVGTLHLANDFLYDPQAIFACPDKHSVVCISWPDTFEAAFTIDFDLITKKGHFDYPLSYAVDYSDFKVRACTENEVESVRHFIETADLKAFAVCTRWGVHAENEDSRQGILHFLKEATSPHDWIDQNSPLLLPEDNDATAADE